MKGLDTGEDQAVKKLHQRRASRLFGREPLKQSGGEIIDKAMNLLFKAEFLTRVDTNLILDEQKRLRLRSVAFNNFGYSRMHVGKLKSALKHLTTALHLSSAAKETNSNSASTHLNIAVVLGRMGKTKEAAKHARFAVKSIRLGDAVGDEGAEVEGKEQTPESDSDEVTKKSVTTNKGNCSLLASAYFNLGFFEEKMKKLELAESHYKMAWGIAKEAEGAEDGTIKIFKDAWEDCKERILIIKRKQGGKVSPRLTPRLTPRAPEGIKRRGGAGVGGRVLTESKGAGGGEGEEATKKDDIVETDPHKDPLHPVWMAKTVRPEDMQNDDGGEGEMGTETGVGRKESPPPTEADPSTTPTPK